MGICAIYCLIISFMCGRTACTLARDDIVKACSFQDRRGKRKRSVWKDAPGGQQYKTSYNMAPGAFAPVLVSSKHFMAGEGQSDVDHVVMPMKWGLVPRWHKESPSKVSFKTSNCRGESMLEKATFKTPLQKGQRCVAVMDGFYEWKTTNSGRQPHFFQACSTDFQFQTQLENKKFVKDENAQVEAESCSKSKCVDLPLSFKDANKLKQEKKEIKAEPLTTNNNDKNLSSSEESNKDNNLKISAVKQECGYTDGCQSAIEKKEVDSGTDLTSGDEAHGDDSEPRSGRKLLTCAAVYDVWQPSHASPPLYSYSIITVAASPDMSWCHHRMPAVLTTDEEICDWLDFSTIPLSKAYGLIQSKSACLTSHPVSKNVNNSRYQSQDCLKPVDLSEEKTKLSGSGLMMMNWLKRLPDSSVDKTCTSTAKTSKM